MRKQRFDVLGLGAVAVDDLSYVEAYPPADSKARVLGRERRCGGLTAVALVAAARLGARCAYGGVLGRDDLSSFALDYLKREKIDLSHVKQTRAAKPVHSNIVVDRQRGTRTIFYDLQKVVGANIHLPAALIRSCRVLFIDNVGMPGMIRAARIARNAGIPTVADFENDSDSRFPELLSLTDHLLVSMRFATKLTGWQSPERAVRALARAGREVSVVTCGDQGCWYLARGYKSPKHQTAFKVKPMDTTGCGDVFHGAYAFALARNFPLEERVRLASAAAALKAAGIPGRDGIPSLAMVKKLL